MPREQEGRLCARARRRLRADEAALRPFAGLGARAAARHAGRVRRDARCHGAAVRRSCRKGFFPVQDTGLIVGVTEAPQTISFAGLVERQQALVKALVADPAVQSLSSFVGVDGTNVTPNSGRAADQPEAARTSAPTTSARVIRRLQSRAAAVHGITLYMQAVQDLDGRRPGQPHAVPGTASSIRTRRSWISGSGPPARRAAPRAGAAGCRHRPADGWCARGCRHRSRHRVAVRHQRTRWWTTRSTAPSASVRCRPSSRS